MGRCLHAGAGTSSLPDWFKHEEVRLDINPECNPDIVADMTDIGDIGPFDAVYCNHALEHLAPHDTQRALTGFHRVLVEGGGLVVLVPDLEDVKATDDVLFTSPAGPITGLDLMYGYRPALKDNPHMAHRNGFTRETLEKALLQAGFSQVTVIRLSDYALMGAAKK